MVTTSTNAIRLLKLGRPLDDVITSRAGNEDSFDSLRHPHIVQVYEPPTWAHPAPAPLLMRFHSPVDPSGAERRCLTRLYLDTAPDEFEPYFQRSVWFLGGCPQKLTRGDMLAEWPTDSTSLATRR